MASDSIHNDQAHVKVTDSPETIVISAPTAPSNLCAHCGKPATQACKGCNDAPSIADEIPSKTLYCNAACQKADWIRHKAVCKLLSSRKQVYRAGETVQQLFYIYQEEAFEKLITKVEKDGNTMYFYEGLEYGSRMLIPFPRHLFASEADRHVVLSYKACTDAVAFMLPFVKRLLKGLRTDIDEAQMRLPLDTPFRTYFVDQDRNQDPTEYPHEVIRVTVRNGEVFALDFAGAQFGYHEPVLPWQMYLQSRLGHRSENGVTFRPCGYRMNTLPHVSRTLDPFDQLFQPVMKYNVELTQVAVVACDLFVAENSSFSEILKLPQIAFERKRDNLLYWLSESLKRFNAPSKETGSFLAATEAIRNDIGQAERSSM